MSEHESLGLHNLPKPTGATATPKRKGRGPGSGTGKTAGRGHKGQRARSGGRVRPGFEGGQMPLIRRLPKRGFRNVFASPTQIVNVKQLDRVAGDDVNPGTLAAAGLVSKAEVPIKLLGIGEVTRAFKVTGCAASKTAREKIERAGGAFEG